MNAASGLSKLDQLRARDGDDCWLCFGSLNFDAAPNSKKAPTLEHLEAKANGGSGRLDNLVLCHPGCNRQLGNRPKADKLKMREGRRKARGKLLAAQAQAAIVRSARPLPETTRTSQGKQSPIAAQVAHLRAQVARWRTIALAAAFVAAVCLGLSIGLWIGR